jgi:hypothetical protein
VSFLKVCPDFAGEPITEWDVVDKWYANRGLAPPPKPFDKRPDIIVRTASGKKVGIELKAWVNQEQIAEARQRERIQDDILEAIGKQPPNQTQHIGYVWLSAKQGQFDTRDAADFRHQLFLLIARIDNDWSRKPGSEQMCSGDVDRFEEFPVLKKYLHRVRFRPATTLSRGTVRWIRFPEAGRHYSPNEMLETLESSILLNKGDERYKDLRAQTGLAEVYLLIHYDFKAFAYNTPFDAPDFGFKEAASFASQVLDGAGSFFDRVFLFHVLSGDEAAYEIFPDLKPLSKR